MRAIWNNTVIADSDKTIELEGYHYFPLESVRLEFLQPSDYSTVCEWKGEAKYYHVVVDGKLCENAAWSYPKPKWKGRKFKNRVAFWKKVQVVA